MTRNGSCSRARLAGNPRKPGIAAQAPPREPGRQPRGGAALQLAESVCLAASAGAAPQPHYPTGRQGTRYKLLLPLLLLLLLQKASSLS